LVGADKSRSVYEPEIRQAAYTASEAEDPQTRQSAQKTVADRQIALFEKDIAVLRESFEAQKAALDTDASDYESKVQTLEADFKVLDAQAELVRGGDLTPGRFSQLSTMLSDQIERLDGEIEAKGGADSIARGSDADAKALLDQKANLEIRLVATTSIANRLDPEGFFKNSLEIERFRLERLLTPDLDSTSKAVLDAEIAKLTEIIDGAKTTIIDPDGDLGNRLESNTEALRTAGVSNGIDADRLGPAQIASILDGVDASKVDEVKGLLETRGALQTEARAKQQLDRVALAWTPTRTETGLPTRTSTGVPDISAPRKVYTPSTRPRIDADAPSRNILGRNSGKIAFFSATVAVLFAIKAITESRGLVETPEQKMLQQLGKLSKDIVDLLQARDEAISEAASVTKL